MINLLNVLTVWTGIVIPIIASIVGGLIGGLFTFLGVKLTIKNDNRIKAAEMVEKVKEKNREIISRAPRLEVVQDDENVNKYAEIYLLPYRFPELISEDEIWFHYGDEIRDKNFWDFYDVTIQNIGETEISMFFLQLNYKSGLNMYTKYEVYGKDPMSAIKYYSDRYSPCFGIRPEMKFQLRVYYPKAIPEIEDKLINAYLEDINGNCWFQYGINRNGDSERARVVSPKEYTLHYRDGYYEWFVYERMYRDRKIPKKFDTKDMPKLLQQRKEDCWAKDKNCEHFRHEVANGKIALNG